MLTQTDQSHAEAGSLRANCQIITDRIEKVVKMNFLQLLLVAYIISEKNGSNILVKMYNEQFSEFNSRKCNIQGNIWANDIKQPFNFWEHG